MWRRKAAVASQTERCSRRSPPPAVEGKCRLPGPRRLRTDLVEWLAAVHPRKPAVKQHATLPSQVHPVDRDPVGCSVRFSVLIR